MGYQMEEQFLLQPNGENNGFSYSPIITEGKKAQRRRGWRTFLMSLKHMLFGTFLTIARFQQDYLAKYLIPAASIPLEIINLISELKNIADKQKPFWVVIQTVLLSLISLNLLVINSIIKWNLYTSAWMVSIMGLAPLYFTCINTAFALLETAFFIMLLKNFYDNPELLTPHRKFNLANRAIKIVGLSVMAGVMLPFTAALSTNPITATILGITIGTVLLTLLVTKIVKTFHENNLWENTIDELITSHQDPYKLLNINRNVLNQKIDHEIQSSHDFKNFFTRLQIIFHSGWGGPQNTAVSYIDECYKKAVAEHPEKLVQLQKAYDLLRKSRGRLKYEKAQFKTEKTEVIQKNIPTKQAFSWETLRQEALQADKYPPLFKKLRTNQSEPIFRRSISLGKN